jgi:hypothetical protein
MKKFLTIVATSILLPAAFGFGGAYGSVRVFGQYGWSLFLVLPMLVSFLSAFTLRRFTRANWLLCYGLSVVSILVLGGAMIVCALDGMMCLLMALPIALVQGVLGSLLGYALARSLSGPAGGVASILFLMTFPGFLGFEHKYPVEPTVRQITSSITIDAPIDMVWHEVLAFDRITAPPTGIFRLGIAYPIQAHIYGQGVGAVRYCVFSTGPFIEPITVWQPPRRLEFDVVQNPVPMKEFSPYKNLEPPHLHGTFVSRHGRFALREDHGKTVLEGTTWYYQRLVPDWYWHLFSDAIIHQIHLRVLEQIKHSAETKACGLAKL